MNEKKNCACPVCKRWQFQEGILYFKNRKFAQEWTKTFIQFGDEHVMQCVGEFLICDVFYFGRNSPISSKQKPTMANGSKGEGTLFFIMNWFPTTEQPLFIPNIKNVSMTMANSNPKIKDHKWNREWHV